MIKSRYAMRNVISFLLRRFIYAIDRTVADRRLFVKNKTAISSRESEQIVSTARSRKHVKNAVSPDKPSPSRTRIPTLRNNTKPSESSELKAQRNKWGPLLDYHGPASSPLFAAAFRRQPFSQSPDLYIALRCCCCCYYIDRTRLYRRHCVRQRVRNGRPTNEKKYSFRIESLSLRETTIFAGCAGILRRARSKDERKLSTASTGCSRERAIHLSQFSRGLPLHFHARRRSSSRALPFYMTFLRRQETSRISSRGKGPVHSTGDGGRTLSRHRTSDSIIISHVRCNRSLRGTVESPLSPLPDWYKDIILEGTSYGQAACMIIEDYPPLPTRSRQNLHQDTTQRFLNHLVLPKHRTSKFSSNRHRKLQPFRET